MKKRFFLCLLLLTMAWTYQVRAQDVAATRDSLVATFDIKNKKAVAVQPNTTTAKAFAQKNTTDLLFILDKFFITDHYRKTRSIKTTQYLATGKMSDNGMQTDSFLSVVYILDMPQSEAYEKQLRTGSFVKVSSRPTKVPEQFYISRLNDKCIILVSVLMPLYRDAELAYKKQKEVELYLNLLWNRYK